MHHTTEIVVRGYHIDLYGHVNHARFVEMMEEARWRFFDDRSSREALSKTDSPVVVVNVTIDYRAPAKVYDTLIIDTSTKSIGRTSAVIHQRITIKESDTVVVDADVTFVAIDRVTGKPVPIQGIMRELLEAAK